MSASKKHLGNPARNAAAAALRSPRYAQRRVEMKTRYSRKPKHKTTQSPERKDTL